MTLSDDDDLWLDPPPPSPEAPGDDFFDAPVAEPSAEVAPTRPLRLVTTPPPAAKPSAKAPAWERHGVRSVAQMLQAVADACKRREPEPNCTTGNDKLDELIGGYRRRHITVLGAATHFGKSTFAIMAFDEADRAGKRALIVSSEDSELLYGKRIASRRTGVQATKLRDGTVDEHEIARLFKCGADASLTRGFLYGVGRSTEELAEAVRELCAEENYDLVIVDYLQAFRAKAQDRRNEVTTVARLFSDAIKSGNAAGLLLSQIKRLESGREPTMSDLKETGDIEIFAEHVIIGVSEDAKREVFAAEDQPARKQRYLKLEKNKDGPASADRIYLAFDDMTASFRRQRT